MINILEDYICHSMPEHGTFETNPNLRKKVDINGKLLPYIGNTVVFLLEESTKQKLHELQKLLYEEAPKMLAEPLQMSSFHMTLHDLNNGIPAQSDLEENMKNSEEHVKEIFVSWKDKNNIHMKTTWLFNMVNTSIVLGLVPVDEENWKKLDEMYMKLESIVPLGYALTPHITMAYFRPGIYEQEDIQKLAAVLKKIEMEVTLCMKDLVLQNFTDMNHYMTVI